MSHLLRNNIYYICLCNSVTNSTQHMNKVMKHEQNPNHKGKIRSCIFFLISLLSIQKLVMIDISICPKLVSSYQQKDSMYRDCKGLHQVLSIHYDFQESSVCFFFLLLGPFLLFVLSNSSVLVFVLSLLLPLRSLCVF